MSDGFLRAAEEWMRDDEWFRQSLERTARVYGIAGELVEKDVFSSLVLAVLAARAPDSLLFKGGTCLSKVYTDFYRLSEDLDFSISVPLKSSRAERRRLIAPLRAICDNIETFCPRITVLEPLSGANRSKQYIQTLGYRSRITGRTAQIRVELGLREPALLASRIEPAGTLLVSPLTGRPAFPRFPVRVMDQQELWAEKIRAGLCRREAAIRDFFDLDYALRKNRLEPSSPGLIALVERKLEVPGTGPIQLTEKKREELRGQIETDLKPVLRTRDLEQFDLDRIWTALIELANRLQKI